MSAFDNLLKTATYSLHHEPNNMQSGLVVDNTVGGIALTPPVGSKRAFVSVFTAAIRFRIDGGAPTATVGHRADVNDNVILENGNEVANFRAIREGATSASLEVTHFV